MGFDAAALTGYLTWIAAAVYPLAAFWAGGHAMLHARDPRSAWGWIAVCLLFPLAGALLYFFFGINRVRRRARLLLDIDGTAAQAETRQSLPPLGALAMPFRLRLHIPFLIRFPLRMPLKSFLFFPITMN